MTSPFRHWLHSTITSATPRRSPRSSTCLSRLSDAHTPTPFLLALLHRGRAHSQLRSYTSQPHPKAKTKSKSKHESDRFPLQASSASAHAPENHQIGPVLRFLHRARSCTYAWFEGCSGRVWWWRRLKQTAMFTAHFLNGMFFVHLVYAHIGRLSLTTGPSMLPTFATSGEIILEDRFSIRHLHAPLVRGDLLVVESPLQRGQMVCKRLLGLPGDVICVDPTGERSPSTEHVKVPEGHVWISGDNAEWSRDSRDYGPVPIALVKGRIVARVWPPHKFTLYPSGSGVNFLT